MCEARIRPFPNLTEVACELEGEHRTHEGTLRDYAYAGSKTILKWEESDRRNFRGEWPGPCAVDGCFLPRGHRGSHAV